MKDYQFLDLVHEGALTQLQHIFFQVAGQSSVITNEEGQAITKVIPPLPPEQEAITLTPRQLSSLRAPIFVGDDIIGYFTVYKEIEANTLLSFSSLLGTWASQRYKGVERGKEAEATANSKSDFLANMSHEIRTPMNAVIGLAEMALREDISDTARDYLGQIKSSGHALLAIINDILDFSKIESGKMEILPVEYEPLTLCREVSNLITTRLQDKDVVLIVDFDPSIPKKLLGDSIRIRQVLTNLLNNAAKFTNKGQIYLSIQQKRTSSKYIELHFSVQDTGIGIREEDLAKLFQSFQQVDSKRNRNVEGTGLGLAICKQLVSLMHGEIGVTSEYEVGSNFYFTIPQEILDETATLQISKPEQYFVLGHFQNEYYARAFYHFAREFSLYNAAMISPGHYYTDISNSYQEALASKKTFLFLDKFSYTEKMKNFLSKNPQLQAILFVNFFDDKKTDLPNVRALPTPFTTQHLQRALEAQSDAISAEDAYSEIQFTAPRAKILIVDDNTINLKVAQGLLEPLKMQITCATSGTMALEALSHDEFDLILMDHMMPELDGIETTRIIRRFHPNLSGMPILALTANAISGMRETFLSEGMNDYIAKPIEVQTLLQKVRKWLPPEKIEAANLDAPDELAESESAANLTLGDLDLHYAIRLLGNEKLLRDILMNFHKVIPTKTARIEECLQTQDWPAYTIEVHALKSAARQIGALQLSDMAAQLEKAGHQLDIATIQSGTKRLLAKYQSYQDILDAYLPKEEEKNELPTIDKEQMQELLERLQLACDNLDLDDMEKLAEKLQQYQYEKRFQPLSVALITALDNIDVDEAEVIIRRWKLKLN